MSEPVQQTSIVLAQRLTAQKTTTHLERTLYLKPAYFWQSFMWFVGYGLLRFFCAIEVRGEHNLQKLPRGIILAANHASHIDGVTLLAGIRPFSRHFPLYYVAQAPRDYVRTYKWENVLYTSWFLTLIGAIAVKKGSKDYGHALKNHLEILRRRHTVAIFPEGQEHTEDQVFSKVHGGVAYLAETANVPIVPVWISGSYSLTFSAFFRRERKIIVTYGAPLYAQDIFTPEESAATRYKSAAQRVCEKIAALKRDS